MDLRKIIRENIEKLFLTERLSSNVYHFTTLNNLYKIVMGDEFILSTAYKGKSDDWDPNKKFFMSLTRQRNGLLGYSNRYEVRICFDGDKLNQRFKGKAIDYWGDSMGKQYYYRDMRNNHRLDKTQNRTENEDRLFSDDPVIENISQYIERIDILVDEKTIDLAHLVFISNRKFTSKLFFYNNEKDFNYQTNNTINDELRNHVSDLTYKERLEYRNLSCEISNVVKFIVACDYGNPNTKEVHSFVAQTLKQYGLGQYISDVLKDIQSISGWFVEDFRFDLHQVRKDRDVYVGVCRMLDSWLKSHGYKSINDAKLDYDKKNNVNNQRYQIDYNKKVEVMVVDNRTILLHPEKVSFWSVVPQSCREWFVDDILNNIQSHNSKSDEHFKKYLQHLVKNEIPITQMLDILDKLQIDEEIKKQLMNYQTFEYKPLDINGDLGKRFINKSEEDEFVSMFRKID